MKKVIDRRVKAFKEYEAIGNENESINMRFNDIRITFQITLIKMVP